MPLRKRFKKEFFLNENWEYKIDPIHHIIFWLVYFIFNTLRWGSYYGDYLYSLKTNSLGFPIHIILCYFTIYLLIPKFIYTKRFFWFIFLLLSSIFLMVFLKFELTYLLISNNVWPEGPGETSSFSFNYIMVMMLGELYVISFVTAIKITIDWMSENKRAAKLKKAQLETELRFLRSQISPHFFFNTLNNIYSLSLNKSHKTPETILKLSELMRYLIYETKPNLQALDKEINCIQNYLDLEKIRYGEKLSIDLKIEGNTANKEITPMLLIPFIENAFKHGANKSIKKVFIKIELIIKEDILYFRAINSLPKPEEIKTYPQQRQEAKKQGGIGIANVKKRLSLCYDKKDYELKIDKRECEFLVDLKLKLE
ncbi:sensor histidine kinase [Salegentibacter sp. F60176]|uniref:Sensor histidine kinase n=1 Tax=Salegentibacter maritimus TaxID=2794347 RepID=A0ABS0TDS4_9FLAO|nr:sensor histidine kinase [Salegentibacter maritimus]MBI6119194.1 sensor histidine kinase [Salegentibacter maritimus]